ncbi:MAG TPA: hypothetical protein DCE42_14345 [Myxococcales bacterium]|nr:hypothetical protein [Deltaproteobacteria bacterium]MBU48390.1 hypothetical protein [Deltaproteobacteria bacterium]HAA55940.1 hypothetical protein [Myxococcales bacterium]|tara:strand:- start:2371 stop:3156 length:786 start_codon:yes stop_codon:yes gene_type:complete
MQQSITPELQKRLQTKRDEIETMVVLLPDVEDVVAESFLFEALTEGEALQLDERLPSTQKSSWGWGIWGGVFACACLALFWVTPDTWKGQLFSQESLTPKGHLQQPQQDKTWLMLGRWDAPKKQLRRLGKGASISKKHGVVFAFRLKKPGGYVTLFHIDQRGKTTQIYPFPGQSWRYTRARKRLSMLSRGKRVQQYTMDDVDGRQVFVLLQSQKRPDERWLKKIQTIDLRSKRLLEKLQLQDKDMWSGTDQFALQVREEVR